MKLTVVRHGETIENKKNILQGHLPGRLSDLGKEQAKKLALRLKSEKFDLIYSSDLARAADTAKEIIKYHKNTPIYYVEELRERNLGIYQGKKRGTVDWENLPRGVETVDKLKERVELFLGKLCEKCQEKSVLFVGHGFYIRILTSVILGESPESFIKIAKPKSTSVFVFDVEKNAKGKIIMENCDSHL